MSSMTPVVAAARSTLYPELSDAELIPCGDGYIASRFHADDAARAAGCGLIDLTALARCGFRGTGAEKHLKAGGLPVPAHANQAVATASGELILRLSPREFWLLGSLEDMGRKVLDLTAAPVMESGCYPLFCQDSHGWFALTGQHGAEVMAKLCAVDLRDESCPEGCLVQTSVARINALVVKHRIGDLPVFSLLFDSACPAYLWEVMLDAMQAFAGAPVGVEGLLGD